MGTFATYLVVLSTWWLLTSVAPAPVRRQIGAQNNDQINRTVYRLEENLKIYNASRCGVPKPKLHYFGKLLTDWIHIILTV